MNDFLPFALPEIDDEEINAVNECLRSGWITTGPKTDQFEKEFASYLGGGVEALSVNSATAGLHLALEALGIGPGDEVILPTLTFTATAEVVRYLGADPVFVDVDPITLNIDVNEVKAATTQRTKAIMPVHYGGLACEMDEIIEFALSRDLHVVEDAAHAFPSRYRGRLVGTLSSDVTVFSFYANKTMTTGEGGMIVTRNPEIARRVKVMRIHGINRNVFDRFVAKTPSWFYEVVAPGYKYNLTDIASALGIHQLRKIDRFLARRQEMARRYSEELANLPLVLPADARSDGVHSWHLYVVRLTKTARIDRDTLIQRLSDNGIGTSVHYIPLHRQPYWSHRYHLGPEQFPEADAAYRCMLSLPLYTKMTDDDQTRVIRTLRELLC
jgi:dTDP-4-amino-4,6-dideoxygalactose transaminase